MEPNSSIDIGFGSIPLGTAPQWVLLAAVLIALIKIWPVLREQTLKVRMDREQGWREQCELLRAELAAQRQQCEAENSQLKDRIHKLEEQIWGLRRQHIQEQLSLINSILHSVDAPELKTLLRALEAAKTSLDRARGDYYVGEQPPQGS